MKATVLAGTATASTLLYRGLNPAPVEPVKGEKLDAAAEASKSEAVKNGYVVEEKLTPLEAITTYNNFYEFDTSKGGVASAAKGRQRRGTHHAFRCPHLSHNLCRGS